MITPASFRQDFPEFSNVPDYPSSVIQYYITLAGFLMNVATWGQPSTAASSPPTTMYDMAQELFVAHHIIIERQAMLDAQSGNPPGTVKGPVNSESVGPISISYASGDVVDMGAGHWNLTVYGLRFKKLVNMFGAGPVQVGIGCNPVPWNSGAWPGPLPWSGWQG